MRYLFSVAMLSPSREAFVTPCLENELCLTIFLHSSTIGTGAASGSQAEANKEEDEQKSALINQVLELQNTLDGMCAFAMVGYLSCYGLLHIF